MRIQYSQAEGQARCGCTKARQQSGAGVCQSFGARRLERAAEELLLASLAPLGMEAMVRTAQLHTQDNQAQRVHWEQKIERASYEVGLARRQYDSVDPQNRLVARELERRYEKALQEWEAVKGNASERLQKLDVPLSESEQQQLNDYALEVEKLWHASSTRAQERKRIARCLLEKVVVLAAPGAETLQGEVHWKGGEVTQVEVARGKPRMCTPPKKRLSCWASTDARSSAGSRWACCEAGRLPTGRRGGFKSSPKMSCASSPPTRTLRGCR
jgi:hypothetical protein